MTKRPTITDIRELRERAANQVRRLRGWQKAQQFLAICEACDYLLGKGESSLIQELFGERAKERT